MGSYVVIRVRLFNTVYPYATCRVVLPLAEVVYLLTPGGSYTEHVSTGGGDMTVLSDEKFDLVIDLARGLTWFVGGGQFP